MPNINSGIVEYFIQFQNRTRNYKVYMPTRLTTSSNLPLVIMLHGGGSNSGTILEKYDWIQKADSEQFILAIPDALVPHPEKPASFRHNPQSWNDGSGIGFKEDADIDDVGFIDTMINDIDGIYDIDQKRVYAAGFSNGASMVFRLGLQLSHRLAAVAAAAGHLWIDNVYSQRPVPAVYIIGSEDPINPLEGGHAHLPWNERKLKPPVRETIKRWLKLNKCMAKSEIIFERNGVMCMRYYTEDEGCDLYYYEINGLGHVWPGGELELPASIVGNRSDKLNATDIIWEFFKDHLLT